MAATLTVHAFGTEGVVLDYASDVDALEMVEVLRVQLAGTSGCWISSKVSKRMVWVPAAAVVVADFDGDVPAGGEPEQSSQTSSRGHVTVLR